MSTKSHMVVKNQSLAPRRAVLAILGPTPPRLGKVTGPGIGVEERHRHRSDRAHEQAAD
jgi:hypothetical protein